MTSPPPAHDAAAIAEIAAFPVSTIDGFTNTGMTLRDWFAGNIAAGMAAHSGTMGTPFGPGDIATRSYEIADAMLSARAHISQDKGE